MNLILTENQDIINLAHIVKIGLQETEGHYNVYAEVGSKQREKILIFTSTTKGVAYVYMNRLLKKLEPHIIRVGKNKLKYNGKV